MKITKHKDGSGGWRVHFDGKPTPFTIAKSLYKPKWGDSQTYDVLADRGDNDPDYLFEKGSVAGALAAIEAIATVAKAEG